MPLSLYATAPTSVKLFLICILPFELIWAPEGLNLLAICISNHELSCFSHLFHWKEKLLQCPCWPATFWLGCLAELPCLGRDRAAAWETGKLELEKSGIFSRLAAPKQKLCFRWREIPGWRGVTTQVHRVYVGGVWCLPRVRNAEGKPLQSDLALSPPNH